MGLDGRLAHVQLTGHRGDGVTVDEPHQHLGLSGCQDRLRGGHGVASPECGAQPGGGEGVRGVVHDGFGLVGHGREDGEDDALLQGEAEQPPRDGEDSG